MKKIVVSYSGGKDSTLALDRILRSGEYEVDSLLITLTDGPNRSTMHGIREELIDAQAHALGFPLRKVKIPEKCDMDTYQDIMSQAMKDIKAEGIHDVMFGDIHLEDVKEYRDKLVKSIGCTPVYPIWNEPVDKLIQEFLDLGYRTVTTCIDTSKVPAPFLGKVMDQAFLDELPECVDVCGENGEFHTFVFDGPLFNQPVLFELGEEHGPVFEKFMYKDLIPIKSNVSK
ncbi:diphthine--ammonia ligase [Texcoconibacillus texcoconensis]|uniref:Uncharacterized protein (TIGR00290 family) n=1 Tax=Texcoconibacillus texcoconensis TaxID=1095777 RepID=A0A840QTM6_9BACI|nr:uncharacterized protein (TIGR00290 family) [Texcoconibacillus texcoconensis]